MALVWLVIFVAAALLVVVIARTQGRARVRALTEENAALRRRVGEHKQVLSAKGESVAAAQHETDELSRTLLQLPEFARRIGAAATRESVERALVAVTRAALGARQAALFAAQDDALVLRIQEGFAESVLPPGKRIGIYEGRVGWAAKKRVILLASDYANESNLVKNQLQADPLAAIRFDACAPLVHRDRLYGVLAVAGAAVQPENAKRVLAFLTELGVIASENARLIEAAQDQVERDPVTGLHNVAHFGRELPPAVARADQLNQPLSVLILDLDQFEEFNRTFGRSEGDTLLRVVAQLIRDGLRPQDLPCRYGGSAFGVILPETASEQALDVANRIRQAVEVYPFSKRRVTISGGLASYPDDGTDAQALTRAAEAGLANAKRLGRNRIAVASR